MAKGENGYSAAKGARAAARKVLGSEAVENNEFEVFAIDGGRFDWKAIERKAKSRRTSGKGNPFPTTKADPVEEKGPTPEEVAAAEAALDAQGDDVIAPTLDDMPIPGSNEPEEPAPSAGASKFGAAMFALGNHVEKRNDTSSRRTSDKTATEKKVKAPAEIKNGVRKPTAGTTCRHVWDELEALSNHETKTYPDSKQVKELAAKHKWNSNNASIEFYQWRKFNGITGRSKPAATAKPIKSKD